MSRKSKKPAAPITETQRPARPFDLDERDLLGQLTVNEGSTLWLGSYTASEIERALEQRGILSGFRRSGLDRFIIRIEPFEEFDQTLRIYCETVTPENLIAEARFREARFVPKIKMPETFTAMELKVLALEWLLMQNPYASFSPQKPPLPGQAYPGLGQARQVTQLLMALCTKRRLAAIVNFPQFFHNAYLYRDYFHFYDPVREADILALHRDLSPLPLADMSWAIEAGCVRMTPGGEKLAWVSTAQLLPMHEAITDYFASDWYHRCAHEALENQRYTLDREAFQKFLEQRAKT
jgi:hypothetical protein